MSRIAPGLVSVALVVAACTGDGTTTTTSTPNTTVGTATTTFPSTSTTTTVESAPTTTLSIVVPEGYTLFDGSADGFSIALPSRWVPIDLTGSDTDALIAELEQVLNPEAIELVNQFFTSDFAFALFAVDVTGDPTVNLIVTPRTALDTVDNLEALIPAQIEELLGGTILSVERVDLAGVQGVQVVYEITFEGLVQEGHQYYVLTEDSVYVFSFGTFKPDDNRDIFAEVMATFSVIEE